MLNYLLKSKIILISLLSLFSVGQSLAAESTSEQTSESASESNEESVIETEVFLTADRTDFDLVTSLSRLQGNVILRNRGIEIHSGFAEVHPKTTTEERRYILGDNLTMTQLLNGFELLASSKQAVYIPDNDELIMEKSVSFHHQEPAQDFHIEAEMLKLLQKDQQLFHLTASGNPTVFSHNLKDRRVVIRAEHIDWMADSQIALLKQASLSDGNTTFSASEISYNTKTGAVSAQGKGDDRPKYRFNSDNAESKIDSKLESKDDT